jgi:hypothetical protein
MVRPALLLGGLLGVLLVVGLGIVALPSRTDRSPVYTVAQVRTHLVRQPHAWRDRTLLLRGVAVVAGTCLPPSGPQLALCAPSRAVLDAADAPSSGTALPLASAGPDPLLVLVRRLPLLGGLLPAPQAAAWGKVATYRLQLWAIPDAVCAAATCYEAVLLDAAPAAPGEGVGAVQTPARWCPTLGAVPTSRGIASPSAYLRSRTCPTHAWAAPALCE